MEHHVPLTPEVAATWLISGPPPRLRAGLDHGLLNELRDLDALNQYERRRRFVASVCWGVPCEEAVAVCASLSPLVEIGAGTGFWAALVSRSGGDVVATDAHLIPGRPSYHEVITMDAAVAVEAHPGRSVLSVWPCYNQGWAAKAVSRMAVGRSLVLVSEGEGGCVGDDALFALLASDFEETNAMRLPQWPGLRDVLTVHIRVRRSS